MNSVTVYLILCEFISEFLDYEAFFEEYCFFSFTEVFHKQLYF